VPSSDFGNSAGRPAQTMREPPASRPRIDDTAAGIISPAATYPSVPALGFFVDGTKCDSLATNQRGGTDQIIPSVVDALGPTLPRSGRRFLPKMPGKAVPLEPENKRVTRSENSPIPACSWCWKSSVFQPFVAADGHVAWHAGGRVRYFGIIAPQASIEK
jgi:hypothetical protein